MRANDLSRGATLIEIMVAVVVVLLVLLALLGTIAYGLAGTRNAEGNQRAVHYAQRLLELTRERDLAREETVGTTIGFQDPEDARIPLNSPPFTDDFEAGTGYTRRLVTRRISNDPTSYESKLWELEVTVFWTVKGRENLFRLVGVDRVP